MRALTIETSVILLLQLQDIYRKIGKHKTR